MATTHVGDYNRLLCRDMGRPRDCLRHRCAGPVDRPRRDPQAAGRQDTVPADVCLLRSGAEHDAGARRRVLQRNLPQLPQVHALFETAVLHGAEAVLERGHL